jgi:hypothetical protein
MYSIIALCNATTSPFSSVINHLSHLCSIHISFPICLVQCLRISARYPHFLLSLSPFLPCLPSFSHTTPLTASPSPPQSQPSASPDTSSTHSHYGISRTVSSHPCPRPSSVSWIRLDARLRILISIHVSTGHTTPSHERSEDRKKGE